MPFLTNLTLGKKIALLTMIGLLFGVRVFSSLGMHAVNQATEAMLQDRLTTARLVSGYVDEALGRALSELEKTARAVEISGANGGFEAQIESLEATYSRLSIYTYGIYLLNEKGQVVWSRQEAPGLGDADMPAYPSVNEALKTGESTISGLVSAPVTNTAVILITSPVKQGSQDGKGVLTVAIDLAQSSIGGFVQPIRLGQTGYVEIVDYNGVVVARTEPGPKLSPFEKSDHSGRFAALIAAGEPARGVCHTCHETEEKVGKRDVLAFVPISKADWGVVIRQSEDEALTPTRELRRNLLLFGIGLVTVALLFVVVTTRDVGNRIKMLTGASQRIAEGDLISPVAVLGRDEVGILAQTLDGMRVKLRTSYDELEQKTKELSSLLSVSEILTSSFDLTALFDAVVAKAVDIIPGADGGALLLQDTEQGKLSVRCAIGLDEKSASQLVLAHGGDFTSSQVADKTDSRQQNAATEVVANSLQHESSSYKGQSYIVADVFHRNRRVGKLIMVNFQGSLPFSPSDHRLLQAIADYIAIAIERALLTKEAEEARALHEADRLRSQFISSVSHELRTPLTLIKGYSTSLLRQNVSWNEETQREFLQIIDDKTDELRDLIDKLLQSAKLEAGAFKLEKEPVLLTKLAQRVLEDTTLRAKKHKFTLEFGPSFPVLEADVRCMEQVLRNLVQNAVKYSPGGGEIIINGVVREGNAVVSVSDEGAGIPPEYQDKVFERFYRVNDPSTHGTHGSGLGLSIARGHIEAHGGEVWLESVAGKGSKFYFSLPLEPAESDE